MKNLPVYLLSISAFLLCTSCDLLKKDDTSKLTGGDSPIGAVGTTVSVSGAAIAGVSNFTGTVATQQAGVSTYNAQFTCTNTVIKNLALNLPGIVINGNTVTASNIQIKNAIDGIELKSGPSAGVLVNYNSSVGDTYPIGDTGAVRTVVSKTEVDDYPYGMMYIKVVKVEEVPNYLKSATGIRKITYIANHKFGLVGFMVTLDDGSSVTFPVSASAQNN
ncbi:MAG: hypothetical protein WCI31_16605 [Prolixibacteraceae bacterium]